MFAIILSTKLQLCIKIRQTIFIGQTIALVKLSIQPNLVQNIQYLQRQKADFVHE